MLAAMKSEMRKILSIRSTYVILFIAGALLTLFAFYVPGWETSPADLASSGFLKDQVVSAIATLGMLAAIIAMLSVTHEYRYNTIMYTLTASKSRTKVFLAKFLTLLLFATVFTAFFGILSPLLSVFVANLRGLDVGPWPSNLWSLGWHTLLGGVAYVMYAFILAMIVRVQVGAIVGYFLTFAMLEPLLGLVLKEKIAYLPFQSLYLMMGTIPDAADVMSANKAAAVVGAYIVGGLIVSWVLFLRRDAN